MQNESQVQVDVRIPGGRSDPIQASHASQPRWNGDTPRGKDAGPEQTPGVAPDPALEDQLRLPKAGRGRGSRGSPAREEELRAGLGKLGRRTLLCRQPHVGAI
jgi:hypothetical protein